LIEAGADVNAIGAKVLTPLMLASRDNTFEVVEAILEAGADADAQLGTDGDSWTALMFAAFENPDPRVITALIQAGAWVGSEDEQGNAALHIHLGGDPAEDTYGDNCTPSVGIVKALLAGGAEVNAENSALHLPSGNMMKHTPLHMAAARASPEVVAVLLEADAKVNAKDGAGETPLMKAVAFNKNKEVVAVLLEAGAKINARNRLGETPLFLAVSWGNPAGIAALVAGGAEVNARNELGETPLLLAAGSEDPALVAALVAAGADVHARNESGETPLFLAASSGSPAAVVALLAAGARVNEAQAISGLTPLMVATRQTWSPAAILSGADVRATDATRNTAMIVSALIEAGADVQATDASRNTALDHAREAHNSRAVTLLIKAARAAPI